MSEVMENNSSSMWASSSPCVLEHMLKSFSGGPSSRLATMMIAIGTAARPDQKHSDVELLVGIELSSTVGVATGSFCIQGDQGDDKET